MSKKVKLIYESTMSYEQKVDELYKLGFRDLEIYYILKRSEFKNEKI